MRFAYINNGMVYDSVEVRPESVFNAGYAAQFVEVPDEVRSGWLFDGSNFIEPPSFAPVERLAEPTKEELLAELQALTAKIQALV